MEAQGDKKKNMFSYFKPKVSTSTRDEYSPTNDEISNHDEQHPVKYQRVDSDVSGYVQLDPAIRTPIWQCPVNERDIIRRAYILRGSYQPVMEYPRTKLREQYRRFQKDWFEQFFWLEYSPNKDAAFCFPCFLFQEKEARYPAFTVDDFRDWKRVNDGKIWSLLMHTGSLTSPHNHAVKSMSTLMNVSGHIDKVMNAQTLEEVKKNRLRLTATIESIRWFCLQRCALRGNDESSSSKNQDNLIEMIKLMEKMDANINNVVLEKAPKNVKYTSPDIQKEILHILAERVKKKIREEVGSTKFCLLVDEAKDISDKEQMTERFFDIVHVSDTTTVTLKKEICNVLGQHDLHIKDIRGQGYDGASNMRGSWNGLQVLF